jgi:biotin operon repressor
MTLEMRPRLDEQTKLVQRLLGDGLTQRARFDLLVFWGRYSGGWYSRAAISPMTGLARRDIDKALAELVEEGIVEVHADPFGPYYSLTTSPQIHNFILQLGHLTPNERRALLSRIAPRISWVGAAARCSSSSNGVAKA